MNLRFGVLPTEGHLGRSTSLPLLAGHHRQGGMPDGDGEGPGSPAINRPALIERATTGDRVGARRHLCGELSIRSRRFMERPSRPGPQREGSRQWARGPRGSTADGDKRSRQRAGQLGERSRHRLAQRAAREHGHGGQHGRQPTSDGQRGSIDHKTYGARSRPGSSRWCRKEAGHVLLHEGPPGQFLPRPLKEVEAESVAYIVSAAHGMATGSYSWPYVSVWAGEVGARALLLTQDRVSRAARSILDASPAPHGTGGRAPGAEAALLAAGQRAGIDSGLTTTPSMGLVP